MAITKEQALTEKEFHYNMVGKDGKCSRWRKNGQTKTWVTRPYEFKIPVKFGLYAYGYVTQSNEHLFHLASECPLNKT